MGRSDSVPFVNLFPDFVGRDGDPRETITRYYTPRNCHWNTEGHRLVADRFLDQWTFPR